MSQKDEFIAMFRAEAGEYVVGLEKGLVELEKAPGDLELVKELNRLAHTLKGTARVFGFKGIQDITHRIESIFERIYNRQMEFTSSMADQIFKGLDLVKGILDKVAKGEKTEMDASAVCQGLDECLSGAGHDPVQSVKAVEPAKEAESGKGSDVVSEYVRVPLSRVNKLLNLIGEMVINKMNSSAKISRAKKMSVLSRDIQESLGLIDAVLQNPSSRTEDVPKLLTRCSAQAQKLNEISAGLLEGFTTEAFHLNPIIDELQSNMKELRMLPISTILDGLPRMVRDIARERGKEVSLVITGSETELDKKVLEGLKSPLMHLLRNAVDHGIEMPEQRKAAGKLPAGTILLSASHEAGAVVIKIEDDGAGIDPGKIRETVIRKNLLDEAALKGMTEKEIVNLIFVNGFSTSAVVTDISGRGIGLDIVRRDIDGLKGKVMVDSRPGAGTSFELILPLTIAIIQVLLVRSRDMQFALPVTSISESLSVDAGDVVSMEGRIAVSVRGDTLPLARLSDTLELPPASHEEEEKKMNIHGTGAAGKLAVVVVSSLGKKIGFVVDQIIGEEEVFIKGLGSHLGKVRNVSGATVLWTGDVVVVLDVEDLLQSSCLGHPATMARKPGRDPVRKTSGKKILVCDDAFSTRELVKHLIESIGYVVETAVDGMDGWEKVARTKYDLVVTDVEMPRMSGFEFCQRIKKSPEHCGIPVILVTALDKEEHKKRGIEAGASAYVVKTAFDQSSLLDSIKRLIG